MPPQQGPWNARQAYDELKSDVDEIKHTLREMQGEEITRLRHRAEAPRRILIALGTPIAVSVIISVLSHSHLI